MECSTPTGLCTLWGMFQIACIQHGDELRSARISIALPDSSLQTSSPTAGRCSFSWYHWLSGIAVEQILRIMIIAMLQRSSCRRHVLMNLKVRTYEPSTFCVEATPLLWWGKHERSLSTNTGTHTKDIMCAQVQTRGPELCVTYRAKATTEHSQRASV